MIIKMDLIRMKMDSENNLTIITMIIIILEIIMTDLETGTTMIIMRDSIIETMIEMETIMKDLIIETSIIIIMMEMVDLIIEIIMIIMVDLIMKVMIDLIIGTIIDLIKWEMIDLVIIKIIMDLINSKMEMDNNLMIFLLVVYNKI